MRMPHSVDSSRTSSEARQAFIDSMKMFNNTLSYKSLIRNIQYVRPIDLLIGTHSIVISDFMGRHGLQQRPQVGVRLPHFCLLSLTHLYSYQPRMR